MPPGRPRNDAKHINAAVSGLVRAVSDLVGVLQRRSSDTTAVPAMAPRRPGQRGAGMNNPKLKAALRSSWANFTPAQRKARIAAMKAGHAKRKRPLAQKGATSPALNAATRATPKRPAARKPAAKVAPRPAPKRKSAWAAMSPEQRAARIAKMQAGRAKVVGAVTTPIPV